VTAQATESRTRPAAAGGGLRGARAPLVTGGVVLAAAALVATRSPYTPGSYGFCPIRAVTGWWCPGCGGLRAVHDLMQGDLAAAWGMNALLVVAVPVLVALWARWAWSRWRGRRLGPVTVRHAAVLAAVLLVFAVLRNIPALEPLLAP